VVDILERELELIFVAIVGTAILGAAIGQDPIDADLVRVENGIPRSSRRSAAVSGVIRA
jgi:hypothetical protein